MAFYEKKLIIVHSFGKFKCDENYRANLGDGFLEKAAGGAKVASCPGGGGERLQEVLRCRNSHGGESSILTFQLTLVQFAEH